MHGALRVTSELERNGRGQDKTVEVLVQAREAYERGDWGLPLIGCTGPADLVQRTP